MIRDKSLDGLRVVFASDFHMKPYDRLRLKRTVNKINEQNADIVLLGGDYVNGHKPGFTLSPAEIASEFAHLKSKYGTVAVMGNHDGWQGKLKIIEELEKNGITVLENTNKKFDGFTVAGVEDLQTSNPDIDAALRNAVSPIIFLTHTPDVFDKIPETVNITLAGHLHGGQILFPGRENFEIPSQYGARYLYGLKKERGKKIYISRGLGTSILPLRFNCPPEIVVIDFIQ